MSDNQQSKLLLSKRFPAHAAIEIKDVNSLKSCLRDPLDAKFHLEQVLPGSLISALHQSCCVSTHSSDTSLHILQVCLDAGAEVNCVDNVGQTPLFYAVTNVLSDHLVPALLSSSAKVNQQRWTDSWTPLHLAAMMGKESVVKQLLSAGANSTLRDDTGLTPGDVAAKYSYPHVADLCYNANPSAFRRERQIKKSNVDTKQEDEQKKLLCDTIERRKLEKLMNRNRRNVDTEDIITERKRLRNKSESCKILSEEHLNTTTSLDEESKEKKNVDKDDKMMIMKKIVAVSLFSGLLLQYLMS